MTPPPVAGGTPENLLHRLAKRVGRTALPSATGGGVTRPFLRWWVPVYLYMGLIFFASSLSRPLPVALRIPFLSHGLHAIEYGLLGFLMARALSNDSPPRLARDFRLWATLFAALYGVSDEWHQAFVPMREPSLVDLLFDGLGSFIGQSFFHRSQLV